MEILTALGECVQSAVTIFTNGFGGLSQIFYNGTDVTVIGYILLIGLSGTIESRTYEKKDGTTGSSISVFVNNIEFCDRTKKEKSNKEEVRQEDNSDIYKDQLADLSDDELPF